MKFAEIYAEELEKAVAANPEEYRFPKMATRESRASFVPVFVAGLATGSSNKDGRAVKATCKRLGIPHTYKAIAAYIAAN